MQAIPDLINDALEIESADAEAIAHIVDRLYLRVTGTKTWHCEASAFGIVYLSKKTIEILWAFVYAHRSVYVRKVEGKMISGDLDLEDDEELALPREMLSWVRSEEVLRGEGDMPAGFPVPPEAPEAGSIEAWSIEVTRRALQFHLFHELAHIFFANTDFPQLIDLEAACDAKAIEWITLIPTGDDLSRRRIHTAATGALVYVASYGINTGRIDGVTHPLTYDRLVDALTPHFDAGQDHVWAFATTILAVHATNEGIAIPPETVPEDGFANFFQCVVAFRDAIHAHANLGGG
jgi:hypothetical protein